MPSELFRPEAYAAQNFAYSGAVAVHQSLPARVVALGAAVVCAALVVFLIFGEYTSKARVAGFLEPTAGLVTVLAPQAGLLQEVYVTEGGAVKKGDPLLVIAAGRASLQTADSHAEILAQLHGRKANLEASLSNQRQLESLEVAALEATHRKLHAEWDQIAIEITIAEKKVASQQSILNSYRVLRENRFVSNLEAEQAAHKLLDYEAALQALAKRRVALQADIERAGGDVELQRRQSAKEQNALERQNSTVDQEITERHQQQASVLLAPSDGVVATLPVHRNQMVVSNQRLVTLMPANATLKATLIVPSKAAGFLQPGQPVVLRYAAFPYQKFGTSRGEVAEIDQSLTLPGESSLPVALEEPAYLVSVALDRQAVDAYGTRYGLKAGMMLEADVRLATRSMLEWLFEPLWSFAGKL